MPTYLEYTDAVETINKVVQELGTQVKSLTKECDSLRTDREALHRAIAHEQRVSQASALEYQDEIESLRKELASTRDQISREIESHKKTAAIRASAEKSSTDWYVKADEYKKQLDQAIDDRNKAQELYGKYHLRASTWIRGHVERHQECLTDFVTTVLLA